MADIDPFALVGSHVYGAVWNSLFEDKCSLEIERHVENSLRIVMSELLMFS
ncbi:MAG: hypothetical protein ACFB11_20120 [Paracoccaceae bacterium]